MSASAKTRRRSLRVELWTDDEEHSVIVRGAKRARMTVSAYLRWLAQREDERVSPHCPHTEDERTPMRDGGER